MTLLSMIIATTATMKPGLTGYETVHNQIRHIRKGSAMRARTSHRLNRRSDGAWWRSISRDVRCRGAAVAYMFETGVGLSASMLDWQYGYKSTNYGSLLQGVLEVRDIMKSVTGAPAVHAFRRIQRHRSEHTPSHLWRVARALHEVREAEIHV